MAAHMLAIACIVALVLPAAGGTRVMDSTRTTIYVHQDAPTPPSRRTLRASGPRLATSQAHVGNLRSRTAVQGIRVITSQ
jgi:hypothetical protein